MQDSNICILISFLPFHINMIDQFPHLFLQILDNNYMIKKKKV